MDEARWWWAAIALGAGSGALLAVSIEAALGTVLALSGAFAFARGPHPAERLVGLYWIAFAVYSIVFFGVTIRFGFYPFYLAFVVSALIGLRRGGLRLDPVVAWLYVGFLATVLTSFVGFPDPIESKVAQTVLAYLVGGLVTLQIRSPDGLRPIATSAVAASAIVAGFVVYSTIQAGFGYRGDVDANPNGVATIIAYGAIVTIAWLVLRLGSRRGVAAQAAMIALLALMVYAMLLLASRSAVIAFAGAVSVLVVRAAIADWRRIRVVVVLVVLGSVGLLLPGGQNLFERFTQQPDNVASAGSRIPLWSTTFEGVRSGSIRELLLGHGFNSSEGLVQRDFPGQPSTHNTYIRFLYEYGAISLTLFAALHAYLFVRAWHSSGRYGLVMLGLLTMLLIANVTGDLALGYAYWLVLGFVTGLGHWHAGSHPERAGEGGSVAWASAARRPAPRT